MKKYTLLTVCISIWFTSCSSDDQNTPTIPEDTDTNILLIIADDLGLDALSGYAEGNIKANTPNLDGIRNAGVTFNNFWSNSVCSPTRSTILTGKYGIATGVRSQGDEISASETSLQAYISNQTNDKYASAIVGKWHLSGNNFTLNPEDMGIDYYAGLYSGAVGDYYDWNLTEDGIVTNETEYATTKFTDLAIDWVNDQDKPWFLWLAYNAPHTPFHLPPANMHAQGTLPSDQASIDANPTPYFMASIEAMDFQIGRLLESIPDEELDNTVIIFMGDNGSPNQVSQAPYGRRRAKGTMYQGGINVPMFISGKGVTRIDEDNALVNATDLFATIASFAGVSVNSTNDSQNFQELLSTANNDFRDFTYSEYFDGITDEWTIRNQSHKLIVNGNGDEEFYNLNTDPYENDNLLGNELSAADQSQKTALEAYLDQIRQ